MYDNKVHKIEHRIVSIYQQWVRPIVRGKETVNVEFRAKISISMTDGYSMIEHADRKPSTKQATSKEFANDTKEG